MLLTREAILQADDSQKVRVDVPEWGEDAYVYVRIMSGQQRALLEQMTRADADFDVRAAVIAATLCDDYGQPMFLTVEDVALLADKALEPLQRIFEAARTLNKLGADAVETAVGNSEATENSTSGTN